MDIVGLVIGLAVGGTLLSLIAQKFGISLGDPTAGGSLDVMSILSNVISGGLGGAVLTGIIGMIKK